VALGDGQQQGPDHHCTSAPRGLAQAFACTLYTRSFVVTCTTATAISHAKEAASPPSCRSDEYCAFKLALDGVSVRMCTTSSKKSLDVEIHSYRVVHRAFSQAQAKVKLLADTQPVCSHGPRLFMLLSARCSQATSARMRVILHEWHRAAQVHSGLLICYQRAVSVYMGPA
jgi:hypothetical protein